MGDRNMCMQRWGPPKNPAEGDSIKSIFGDLSYCALAYFLGAVFLSLEMCWLSVAWIILSEVVCILYLRDSLTLTIITLIFHPENLIRWQNRGESKPPEYSFFKIWPSSNVKNEN